MSEFDKLPFKVSKKPGILLKVILEKREYYVLVKVSQRNKNLYMEYASISDYRQDIYGFFPWSKVGLGSKLWCETYNNLKKIVPEISEQIKGFK